MYFTEIQVIFIYMCINNTTDLMFYFQLSDLKGKVEVIFICYIIQFCFAVKF